MAINQTETITPPGGRLVHRASPSQKHGLLWRWRRASPLALIYAACILIFYTTIFLIPFGTAIWLSFQNWDFLTTPKFVGLRNFAKALTDDYFWQALRVSLLFSVVEIALAVSLALLLALALSHVRNKPQRFFLVLYYLPVVTPTVASIYLWRWLYRPTGGTLNALLASLGLPEQPFLASPDQALWCITAMVIWANVGGAAVILLAGMNDVPESLYEAARLDGAGFWQMFLKITMPLIRPVLVYQVVVSVIGTVQMFDPFFLIPGPGFSTRTLSLYTYQLGFQTLNLGYGAAVSLIVFVLLLFATVFQLQRWQVNWEH
ncbi:MAG: carbohydrate ABC transporter permease [Caldilineaceae bacterium]|jgi:multiple sugar transport system permease protein